MEKSTSGTQTANDGARLPFRPNCSKAFVNPMNKSHNPIAYPTVITFPFLLKLKANGAVNNAITNGSTNVANFLSSATAKFRFSTSASLLSS